MKNWQLFVSLVIHTCMSALWWGLTALKFRSPGFDIRAPQDPPNMKKKYIFSYFGFKLKNFLSDCFLIWYVHRYGLEDSWKARLAQSDHWRPPQGPLISPKYFVFTFWLMYETLVFKLVPLVVYMSPLWWGLHLLTFRWPWCPWILCKGSTWPRQKIKKNIFLILKLKRLFLSYCFYIWHAN